jgi:diketogulonate reductase-like aldo/keto reductase
VRIADAHSVTGPQVILSWGVQRGTSVIPKTSNHERLRENMTVGWRTSILTAAHEICVTAAHISLCRRDVSS